MTEQRVVLSGELSLETMAAILLRLEPLWDPLAPLDPVHFDLTGATFIWPAAITLLTTTVLRLRQDGFPVRITRPVSEKADSYLNRIDFYALTEVEADYPWPRYSADGRFREVVQVQSEKEGEVVAGELVAILSRNVGGVGDIYRAVQYTFDGALWVHGNQVSVHSAPFWPGTWVGLRFRTDQPVDTKAIFDQFAPPENEFEWLFGN